MRRKNRITRLVCMLHHTEIQYWYTSVSRFLPLIVMRKDMCVRCFHTSAHLDVVPQQRPDGQYVSHIIETDWAGAWCALAAFVLFYMCESHSESHHNKCPEECNSGPKRKGRYLIMNEQDTHQLAPVPMATLLEAATMFTLHLRGGRSAVVYY